MRPSSMCLHRGTMRLLLTNRAKVRHQFPRNKNIFHQFNDTYWPLKSFSIKANYQLF